MELNKHLEALAIREKSDTGNILPAYEVKRWPAGRLEELIELGELIQIEDATSIKCPACSRGCSVEPVRGVNNDGTEYCEVMCTEEGSPDIDPFYLKQWQLTEKIRTHLPKTKKEQGDTPQHDYIIKNQGSQHLLIYKGNEEILPKKLGSKYIVYLLTHKDENISSLQLENECAIRPSVDQKRTDDVSSGLREVEHAGDLGDLADYNQEDLEGAITTLEGKIENTESQAERQGYQEQIDYIRKYMSGSTDIRGRKRKIGDPLEASRVRVTQNIKEVIKNIKNKDLKKHLKLINTGKYPSYKPDDAVFWEYL